MSEYPYPLYDKKGKVACQICGKPFLVISPRHLQKHNVKYADYTRRFPKAPLSNEEFVARGKYGKNKDLFIHPEGEIIGEDVLVDEPGVEELDDVEEFMKRETQLDPIAKMKAKIRDHLKLYFTNIQMDYLLSQFGPDENLKFEFITDFCDPVLKVVIQFPDTFWHNRDTNIDLNKNLKLKKYGWKVCEVPSNNPSYAQIDKALKGQ